MSDPLPTNPILSCPFCGNDNQYRIEHCSAGIEIEYLECQECGAQGPSEINYDKALIAWNRRVSK